MTTYYVDASALIKRYVQETGTAWLRSFDYDFVELDLNIVVVARNMLERHPLRAYDAIQLASALIADQALQATRLPPLVFLSADDRLNTAAIDEGLRVDNPNLHP